jgi:IS66 Orf2 like protein
MIGLPANTRLWLAAGRADMHRGFDGLRALVHTALADDPFSGHVVGGLGPAQAIDLNWQRQRRVRASCISATISPTRSQRTARSAVAAQIETRHGRDARPPRGSPQMPRPDAYTGLIDNVIHAISADRGSRQ